MKFDSLQDAIDWLGTQSNVRKKTTNDKVNAALDFLGHPERDLPILHITGTNGKGSVSAYLKNLLISQGLKVGTFTSPHIMRMNERITFDGQDISDEDLKALIEKMVPVNEYLASTEHGRLVYFENYTVMMALYFQEKQPDVIVTEVGIGGTMDSTNVMDAPVAVITTVALDHADKLGNTIEEVASNKAGIIKKGAKVVLGRIGENALKVIEEKVDLEGATPYRLDQEYGYRDRLNLLSEGSNFIYWNEEHPEGIEGRWQTQMLGEFQVDNSVVAITAFNLWMEHFGQAIDVPKAQLALAQTQWIARMEKIHDKPTIYIDGAHNKHGLLAISKLVDEYFQDKKITLLYAGLMTKNQQDQLEVLHQMNADTLNLTTFSHYEAMDLDGFQATAERSSLQPGDYHLIEDWQGFVKDFIQENDSDHLLLVTGSLYFVSAVRQLIFKEF